MHNLEAELGGKSRLTAVIHTFEDDHGLTLQNRTNAMFRRCPASWLDSISC